jgi:transcription elongation factor GreA
MLGARAAQHTEEGKPMSDKPAYLTREGLAKLEAELEELTTNGRKDIAERINAAKELGDISESGEYEDAKNQQAHLEGRIREIKNILSRAQIIDEDQNGHGEVRVGSRVTVRVEGKISNESPIGSALLGKRIRQKVMVDTPSGQMKLTVVKIN